MKKLLVIHNKYQNIGGEDTSVENEVNILKNIFNTKTVYFNNQVSNLFMQAIYFLINHNFESVKKIKQTLNLFDPSIIYVHNTWFKASPAIFKVLLNFNSNVFLKLHNFRYDCTRYFLTKNHLKSDSYCSKCGLSKNELGYFNKYFTESYLKSIFVILYGKKYYKVLNKKNLKLLVLTNFHKKYLINLGFKENKVFVLPNHLNVESKFTNNALGNYIVYAGRVSKEKGVQELIESFLKADTSISELKIIGSGPILEELKIKYNSNKVNFLGEISNAEVLNIISNSKGVVTATKLFEGQPTLLCEASALGVISVFPDTGGIKEFFPKDYKYSFIQGNYKDLIEKIKMLENDKSTKEQGVRNSRFFRDLMNQTNLEKFFRQNFIDSGQSD